MVDKRLLELKIKAKKKKPLFSRKDNNKKPRIENDVWRKARGTDNKTRLRMKGHRRWVSPGYRSPVAVRGVHKSGLVPVLVSNPAQIAALTKDHGIIVASVGDRKRQLILQEAKKHQITVINLDAEKTIEQITARLKSRQADRQKQLESQKAEEEKQKKKEEKKTAAASAKAEENKPAEELNDEEKQEKEKEEKNKVLTHK